MNYFRLQLLILMFLAFFASSCKREPQRSFYYWKTVYNLSEKEKSYLDDLRIKKLYVRFFDVDWNETSGKVLPVAKISFADSVSSNFEVVPVVYIVNRALKNTEPKDIPELGSKILKQVNGIASRNRITYNELQLDCDWTDRTKTKYFDLLRSIKSEMDSKKQLSATIRLHQIKYKDITGLPPVDRGMLMYYNMGKISADDSPNSVFNTSDASKYINYLPDYPLPLDVALPAFSWGIHIRNGKVIELLNSMNLSDFENNPHFTPLNSSSFSASYSFFYHGFYFMENDVVKVEEITPQQCNIAAQQLKTKLKKKIGTVAIFHLDSLILTHYENEDFEKVFDTYN